MSDTAMAELTQEAEAEDDFDPTLEISLGDGSTVSLGDLMGLDTSKISRVEMDVVPTGIYHFEAQDSGLETIHNEEHDTNTLIAVFQNRVVACKSLQDDSLDPANYVDDIQRQVFWIKTEKDIGKVLDFMEKAGFVGNGSFGKLVKEFSNRKTEFIAPVITKASKKDPDFFNANIRRLKVRPAHSANDLE